VNVNKNILVHPDYSMSISQIVTFLKLQWTLNFHTKKHEYLVREFDDQCICTFRLCLELVEGLAGAAEFRFKVRNVAKKLSLARCRLFKQ